MLTPYLRGVNIASLQCLGLIKWCLSMRNFDHVFYAVLVYPMLTTQKSYPVFLFLITIIIVVEE